MTVLDSIPVEGATVPLLADAAKLAPDVVEAAVGRLVGLQLAERQGPVVRLTPFAQKARSMFNIVA